MKKALCIIFLVAVLLQSSACTPMTAKPDDGVWCSDDLNMSINFSLYKDNCSCVKIYDENGEYEIYDCHIDYGKGIFISKTIEHEVIYYLSGTFTFKDNKFTIKRNSDGREFVFKRAS